MESRPHGSAWVDMPVTFFTDRKVKMETYRRLRLTAFVFSALVFVSNASINLPNCPNKCGDVDIPYPFGIKEGCYRDNSTRITCNESFTPHRAFLGGSNIRVKAINISTAETEVYLRSIGVDCYNETGGRQRVQGRSTINLPYHFSTRNKFVSVGCNTISYFTSIAKRNFSVGCLTVCSEIGMVTNGTCSGIGCCQVSIPKGVSSFRRTARRTDNDTEVMSFNPCSFSFLVEESAYKFNASHLLNRSYLVGEEGFPVMLDWSIGNQTCDVARKSPESFACKNNSDCLDSFNGDGYFCRCRQGFEGNPYLEDGCQVINRCTGQNDCTDISRCNNGNNGNYTCRCPKGYHGDGRKNGSGCMKNSPTNIIILVTALSCLFLSSALWSLYWIFKRRQIMKMRQNFFKQNGGMLLEQHISLYSGDIKTPEILTSEELKKATKNYHESHILGEGGFGVVYKGILPEGKVVAIKKSKITEKSQIVQFINEVSILSQIDHKNVVKLMGCCLDTPVPMLVYEFIAGGTLYDHIHEEGFSSSLSWKERVRIASETANALAHLHSLSPMPIFHRDIKSQNILLDENYTAKVADFGASRSVPFDRTHITTVVQGTLGYLDPEYFQSSQLTDKSDVYSFGIVLLELLTGELPISPEKPPEERHLAARFISSMKANRLKEVLASRVVEEAKEEEIFMVAELVSRCLEMKGEDRPDMKNIALDLEKLRVQMEHPWSSESTEETQHLLGEQR